MNTPRFLAEKFSETTSPKIFFVPSSGKGYQRTRTNNRLFDQEARKPVVQENSPIVSIAEKRQKVKQKPHGKLVYTAYAAELDISGTSIMLS